MLKVKKYGIVFFLVFALIVACTNKTYDYNTTAVPVGINYSYYNSGPGTSFSDGALIINVHSNSTNPYNEYYVVQIFGLGSYNIQPGYTQLFIPNVWANYYNFSIEKVCAGSNNTNCIPRTLTGIATINTETTTVVDAWL